MSSTLDYDARLHETRRDLREAKIGLAQWLVLEVIFDYGFAVGQATAWIPSFDVFVLRTGMGKKEIGDALTKLESYQILEWESAPQAEFPHARRYNVFPRSARAWSIAPRVPDMRLQERAAKMDRWLCTLNASGGPAQGDMFPPRWDHADTLAEVQASPQSSPPYTPPSGEARPDRAPAPRPVAESSTFPRVAPLANRILPEPSIDAPFPAGDDRGEIPHAWGNTPRPLNGGYGLNERALSLPPNQNIEWEEPVGNFPTPDELDADRPENWPPREVENRLMRRLAELMLAFYASDSASMMMQRFGGVWRWRIRQWPFAVEQAIERTVAQWSEVKKLGGFLNREWSKIWRKRGDRERAELVNAQLRDEFEALKAASHPETKTAPSS